MKREFRWSNPRSGVYVLASSTADGVIRLPTAHIEARKERVGVRNEPRFVLYIGSRAVAMSPSLRRLDHEVPDELFAAPTVPCRRCFLTLAEHAPENLRAMSVAVHDFAPAKSVEVDR